MAEATKDRFVGYPTMTGWEDDEFVPFWDRISQRSVYPLDGAAMPLEWNVQMNFDETNVEEHLPDRPLAWYSPNTTLVSTENAAYFMQGGCDPNVTDPDSPLYYPDCTTANNDVYKGGVVRPTATNFFLYDKAKDFAWMLKALFEIHTDVKTMGVFFANDGAGSVVQYPATQYDGRGTYTSIGCKWNVASSWLPDCWCELTYRSFSNARLLRQVNGCTPCILAQTSSLLVASP